MPVQTCPQCDVILTAKEAQGRTCPACKKPLAGHAGTPHAVRSAIEPIVLQNEHNSMLGDLESDRTSHRFTPGQTSSSPPSETVRVSEPRPLESRPLDMTAISIIGFLGFLALAILVFTPVLPKVGYWLPLFVVVFSGIGMICMVGMWQMQRWSVYMFLTAFLLSQMVLFLKGAWNLFALIGPLVILVFAWKYHSKMVWV